MRNCLSLLWISFLLCLTIGSPATESDSLENVLISAELPKEDRIDVLKRLAYLKRLDIGHANKLLMDAVKLAEEAEMKAKLCETFLMYAKINNVESDIDKEKEFLQSALQLSRELNNRSYEAQAYFYFGTYYGAMEKRDSALIYLQRSLMLARELDDSLLVADAHQLMGIQYQLSKMGDIAFERFDDAISIYQRLKKAGSEYITAWYARVYANDIEDLERTLRYSEQLLQLKTNLFKSDGSSEDFHEQVFGELKDKPIGEQIDQLERALQIAEEKEHKLVLIHLLLRLAHLHSLLPDHQTAIELASRANRVASETNHTISRRDAAKALSEYHEEAGNFKESLTFYRSYVSSSDSLKNAGLRDKIATLQVKFESAEKKRQIALLENTALKQEAHLTELGKKLQRRNGLILIAGLLILTLFFVVRYFLLRSKANKALAKKNEELHRQKIEEMKKNEKILNMNAMIEGQEAERARIASELHDGLGSLLSTASRFLSDIEHDGRDDNIAKVSGMIEHAYRETRQISHDLLPGALMRFGLDVALQELVDAANRASSATEFYFENLKLQSTPPKTTQAMIYRIVQECIHNINKHADASGAHIQISEGVQHLHISIEDNGKGFDKETVLTKKGLGLSSIESRVNYLNGKLQIHSTIGKGTVFDIMIPLTTPP